MLEVRFVSLALFPSSSPVVPHWGVLLAWLRSWSWFWTNSRLLSTLDDSLANTILLFESSEFFVSQSIAPSLHTSTTNQSLNLKS